MVLDIRTDFDGSQESDEEEDDDTASEATHQTPLSPTLRAVKAASATSSPVMRSRQRPRHRNQQLRRLHVGNLLEMILQDAQTRLVFRAQAVVQSEIRYYLPKEGDLDYPSKLLCELFSN
jgi:conserved oligomeric Golgi complex subunit 3